MAKTYRLLVIDDQINIGLLFADFLTSIPGVQVTTCSDSLLGLMRARDQRPSFDLIVTDLEMPRMRGDDLLLQLRDHNITIPVVLVCGSVMPDEKQKYLDIGFADVIIKPDVLDPLSDAVRSLLGIQE